ncbi:MAG: stage II sporulation protein D [Oscillospiraceae bacterium]|jgi:stage II sporulation protein D
MKKGLLNLLLLFLVVLCIPLTAFLVPTPAAVQDGSSDSGTAGESGGGGSTETFKLLRTSTGEVLELSAADYIKGVVSAEIPMDYETEAIKAQAVAAHTYALRMKEANTGTNADLKGADFSDDPSKYQAYVSREEFSKMYGDKADEYWKKCSDAVDAVIGKVMLYEDEPIAAAFHSTSSGKTESAKVVWGGDYAYLVPVDSAADQNAPSYLSEKKLTFQELSDALKQSYPDFVLDGDKVALFQIQSTSDSGTITEAQVGNLTLSGVQIRAALGLSSANFTVQYKAEDDSYTFTTRGLGHGVGMSQYGANQMAASGKSYEEILTHYYTGITLSDL